MVFSFLFDIYVFHLFKMNRFNIRMIVNRKETKFTHRNVDHFLLFHYSSPSSSYSNNNHLKSGTFLSSLRQLFSILDKTDSGHVLFDVF